ncbi:tyrosine-type recombinase/integrase [Desulfosalsimonas propionicica]|nr:site-specific integrase [Desulfosalsimonas propionicica]
MKNGCKTKGGNMAKIAKRRNRYVLDYYDNGGKRVRESLPQGTTLKKAKDKLREIEDQLSKGNYIPDKKMPLFKEVAKDWVEYKKPNLRQSTWSTYDGITRNHFDAFNDLKISRITTAMIEKFIRDRLGAGMNILTLRKILLPLGQIMAYAVRHGYISYNPVRDAERPRGQGNEQEKKIRVLTPAEIQKLLDAVTDQKYKTLFQLAIMSGARQGELLGLKWSDVDWTNNQIHIQRTFNNQLWYDVKTRTSNRRVDLGPQTMADLKRWKLACKPGKLNLIFPNQAGGAINHNNMIYRYFSPALKKAGIGKIRFHDLRHTKVSLMIEQGENIKYIQSQMGHSSPTVTLNVYAHLMKPVNQESARRFEKVILG